MSFLEFVGQVLSRSWVLAKSVSGFLATVLGLSFAVLTWYGLQAILPDNLQKGIPAIGFAVVFFLAPIPAAYAIYLEENKKRLEAEGKLNEKKASVKDIRALVHELGLKGRSILHPKNSRTDNLPTVDGYMTTTKDILFELLYPEKARLILSLVGANLNEFSTELVNHQVNIKDDSIRDDLSKTRWEEIWKYASVTESELPPQDSPIIHLI